MSFRMFASAVVQTWKLRAMWPSKESNIRGGFGYPDESLKKKGQDTKAALEGIYNLMIQHRSLVLSSTFRRWCPLTNGIDIWTQRWNAGLGVGLLRLGSSYQGLA